MTKDKVESRTERVGELLEQLRGCTMSGSAQVKVAEIRELLAARPSVPAQGQALSIEEMFGDWLTATRPERGHLITREEGQAIRSFGKYVVALAASRSEAQPPQESGQLIMQRDWVALLTEICKVYGILEPEWDDADIHAIAEEFDPWNALREIAKKLAGAPAAGSAQCSHSGHQVCEECQPEIRAAGSAERWIPVSELPILYSSALIAHNETRDGKATVEEAQYVGSDEYGQWCLVRTLRDDESIYLTEQVTHWRPLPEPPALAGTHTEEAKREVACNCDVEMFGKHCGTCPNWEPETPHPYARKDGK